MRVALNARVSTSTGQDPEMQLRELRDFCLRRGWEIVGEFVDTGFSGATQRRPQLDRLLMLARKAQFNIVIVYRYDRFARSLRQLVNALGEFEALGIEPNFASLEVDLSPFKRQYFGGNAPSGDPRAASRLVLGCLLERSCESRSASNRGV